MSLINCKVELNLDGQSTVFFLPPSPNHNNIILTIKDTKLYTPVVTLSGKDNQKLLKLLSKGFEISVYWNEYKTKVRIKIRQRNIDNFFIQILLELIDYFF